MRKRRTLGFLYALIRDGKSAPLRDKLKTGKDSRILLFSTEEASAAENYRKVDWRALAESGDDRLRIILQTLAIPCVRVRAIKTRQNLRVRCARFFSTCFLLLTRLQAPALRSETV